MNPLWLIPILLVPLWVWQNRGPKKTPDERTEAAKCVRITQETTKLSRAEIISCIRELLSGRDEIEDVDDIGVSEEFTPQRRISVRVLITAPRASKGGVDEILEEICKAINLNRTVGDSITLEVKRVFPVSPRSGRNTDINSLDLQVRDRGDRSRSYEQREKETQNYGRR